MNRLVIFQVVTLLFAGGGPFGSVGLAATLRVPRDFKTIEAATNAAHDGDVIAVEPGTYRENIVVAGKSLTLTSSKSPTSAASIRQTVLDGSSDKKAATIDVRAGAKLRLVGVSVVGGAHGVLNAGRVEIESCYLAQNKDCISFESGQGVVRNCLIEANGDDGIDMDNASQATIEDNVIRNNKDDGVEIRLHKVRDGRELTIVIRRNFIGGNHEDGIQLIDYPGLSPRHFCIERNIFAANSLADIACMPDGDTKEKLAGADLLERVEIVNNTFAGGRQAITGGDNMAIWNNLFVGYKESALRRVHGDSTAGPNLLWNNAEELVDCDLDAKGCRTLDPRLGPAFALSENSPAKDAGTASHDHNGENLTVTPGATNGKAPDLGALELGLPPTAAFSKQHWPGSENR